MNPFTDILASTPTATHANRSMEVLTERMKELGYTSPNTPPMMSSGLMISVPDSADPVRSLEQQFAHFSAVKSNPSIASPHTLMLTPNSHSYEQQRNQVLDYIEKIRELIGSFDATAIMEKLDDLGSVGSSLDATSDITDNTKQTQQNPSEERYRHNHNHNHHHNNNNNDKQRHLKISTLQPLDCQMSSLDYVSPLSKSPSLVASSQQPDKRRPSSSREADHNKALSQDVPSNSILQKQPFYSPIATTQLHSKSFYDTTSSSAMRNLYQESTLNHTYSSNRYSVGLNMLTMSRAHNSADLNSTSNFNLNNTFNTVTRSGKHVQKELFPVLANTSSNLFFSPTNTSTLLPAPTPGTNLNSHGESGKHKQKKEFVSEFTVIGIPTEVMTGRKELARSSRQGSEVLGKFPSSSSGDKKQTIVENIQEYLFPHGVDLQLLSYNEYKKKQREHAFEHTYQIMQFTDASNRIYYAYALIFTEQIFHPSAKLLQELEDLQILHLAANTIKRYLRYFMYQKTMGIGDKIEDAWKQNIFHAQQRSNSESLTQTPQQSSSTDKTHKRQRSATIHSIFSAVKSVKHAVIGKKHKDKDKPPPPTNPPTVLRSAMKAANPNHLEDTATESSEGGEAAAANKTNWRGVRVNIRDMAGNGSSSSAKNAAHHKRSRSAPDYTAILQASNSSSAIKSLLDNTAANAGIGGLSTRNNLSDIILSDDLDTSAASSHTASRHHLKHAHSSTPTGGSASKNNSFASHWQSLQLPEIQSDYDTHLASSSDSQTSNNNNNNNVTSSPQPMSKMRSLFTSSKSFVQYHQQQSERVVVAQKAYLILSECSLPALFFRVLQAILDTQVKKKFGQQAGDESVATNSSNIDALPLADADLVARFLRFVQSQDHEKVQKSLWKHEVNLSQPPFIRSLMIPKQAPNLAEWTVSVLLSIFPVEVILQIHAYLLLEKSLLVLSSDPCLTSILATAFVHLLHPFNWAGIFVPLLPPLAQEVLDAPVPYIIGMAYPSSYTADATKRPKLTMSTTAMILYVDDFLLYPQCYTPQPTDLAELRSSVSRVDQEKQKHAVHHSHHHHSVHTREEDDPSHDLPSLLFLELCAMDYQPGHGQVSAGGTNRDYILLTTPNKSLVWKQILTQLQYLHGQFQAAVTNNANSINHAASASFLNTTNLDNSWPDRKQVLLQKHQFIKQLLLEVDATVVFKPVRKVLDTFATFNRTWTCEILQHSFGWRDICHEDHVTGSLLIHMNAILEHHRQQMLFQEAIIRTQMFTLLLDQQYATYNQHLATRQFLYDWVCFRHHLKAKKPSIFQRRSRKHQPPASGAASFF